MPNDALKITPSFFLTDEALKRLGLWSSLFFFFADFLNQEVWEKNFKHFSWLSLIKMDTTFHLGTLYMMMDKK